MAATEELAKESRNLVISERSCNIMLAEGLVDGESLLVFWMNTSGSGGGV